MKKTFSLVLGLALVFAGATSQAADTRLGSLSRSMKLTRTPDQHFQMSFCTADLAGEQCDIAADYTRNEVIQVVTKLTQDRNVFSRALDYPISVGGTGAIAASGYLAYASARFYQIFMAFKHGNTENMQQLVEKVFGSLKPALFVGLGAMIYGGYRVYSQHHTAQKVNQAALENLMAFINSNSSEEESIKIPIFFAEDTAKAIPAAIVK